MHRAPARYTAQGGTAVPAGSGPAVEAVSVALQLLSRSCENFLQQQRHPPSLPEGYRLTRPSSLAILLWCGANLPYSTLCIVRVMHRSWSPAGLLVAGLPEPGERTLPCKDCLQAGAHAALQQVSVAHLEHFFCETPVSCGALFTSRLQKFNNRLWMLPVPKAWHFSKICSCSVKDRIACNMIRRAEEQGLISSEHTTLVSRLVHCHTAEHFADNMKGYPTLVSKCCLTYKQLALQSSAAFGIHLLGRTERKRRKS